MDIFLQIVISGLTVGAMYAAGTIALSLLWSSMGMLNLANGAFIAIGGYAAYWCMTVLHASWIFALPVAAVDFNRDPPRLPKAWPNWAFWQHSETGAVSGVTGPVDLDRFQGDLLALQTFVAQSVLP